MTMREKQIKWVAERAYYLWLESGCVHGKDKEHHAEAEAGWVRLQTKYWRSWNLDARYDLMIDLDPNIKDVRKRVEQVVRLFFKKKDGNEGNILSLHFRCGFMMIWLDKAQPDGGYEHDWRTCDLPKDWDAPIEEPTELILSFRRFHVEENPCQSIRQPRVV
jgi:hypothetical protein